MTFSPTGSRTVLIATTEPEVESRFVGPLRDAGHHTVTARVATGLVAALKPSAAPVDLLLLDLGLAHGDDVDLVQQVRTRAPSLPMMVFSGSVAGAGVVRALAPLGIAGYVNEHCDTVNVLTALAPHLFPDSFNRRNSPRITLAVPVSYGIESAMAAAVTLNLGPGGLAVRTMNPLRVAHKVQVRFRLPGTDRDIEAQCRVAWSNSRVGMGLQFEQLIGGDQTAIDDYVDEVHRPSRRGR